MELYRDFVNAWHTLTTTEKTGLIMFVGGAIGGVLVTTCGFILMHSRELWAK